MEPSLLIGFNELNRCAVFNFTKDNRLLTKYDFKSVLDHPNIKVASDNFVLFYAKNSNEKKDNKRLGLIVSKKAGNAVRRNYIKRSLREFFRTQKNNLAAGDYVALARPYITKAERKEIKTQIEFAFKKLTYRFIQNSKSTNEIMSTGVKSDTSQH